MWARNRKRGLARSEIYVGQATSSENIPTKIFILCNRLQLLLHIRRGNSYLSHLHVRGLEAQVLEQPFQNRVEPPCPNVLSRLIDSEGELRQSVNRVVGEFQLDSLGLEEGGILLRERILRLFEDADKVILGQVLQFHADGEAALQFRHQVAGLGFVERASGDEQDVVSSNLSVAGLDVGPFHDGEQIPLHTLAGNIGSASFAGHNFVELVDENDSDVLGQLHRGGVYLVGV